MSFNPAYNLEKARADFKEELNITFTDPKIPVYDDKHSVITVTTHVLVLLSSFARAFNKYFLDQQMDRYNWSTWLEVGETLGDGMCDGSSRAASWLRNKGEGGVGLELASRSKMRYHLIDKFEEEMGKDLLEIQLTDETARAVILAIEDLLDRTRIMTFSSSSSTSPSSSPLPPLPPISSYTARRDIAGVLPLLLTRYFAEFVSALTISYKSKQHAIKRLWLS